MRTRLILTLLLTGSFAARAGAEDGPRATATAAGSAAASATRDAYVAQDDPLGEAVAKVVYLDQGWSPDDSRRFYFTSQGSQIIPYEWFLALEQPGSAAPFRDNRNILRFRYLPQLPGPGNPDGLPVGFVADEGADRKWLGLTCAACHTAEIRHGDTGYRIDGAPTMGDVRALLSSLIEAMQKTRDDPEKFARFASRVLGEHDNQAAREYLKLQMEESIKVRVGYNLRNFPHYDPAKAAPPPDSYGRLDALGAIANEVYNFARDPGEDEEKDGPPAAAPPARPAVAQADAPVSYPFLWDIPGQNLVQWVGLPNGGPLGIFSLSRNVGEALGVFAGLAIPDKPTIFGYASTVRVDSLIAMEDWLKTLRAPAWPAGFPPIDRGAAALGKVIYKDKCWQCHKLIEEGDVAIMAAAGTDPRTWDHFFGRVGPSGKLEGAFENVVDVTERARIGATADAPTMLRNAVIGTIVGAWKQPPPDVLTRVQFRRTTLFAAEAAPAAKYKSRPLDGIWATAPYLHNGSVPNLDELLQPVSKRSKSFSIGVRTFDPARVGFQADMPGFPKFTVNGPDGQPIPGNSNAGHDGPEYGTDLRPEQRRQLIEYLKTL